MTRRDIIATVLIVVSLLLYLYSIFIPWIYEDIGYLMVEGRLEAWFRSYDVVLRAVSSVDNGFHQSYRATFQVFWLDYYKRMDFAENIYIAWLGVFVFQMSTLFFMALSLAKERLRGKTWHKNVAPIFPSISLLLSVYQWSIQMAYNGYVSKPVYFELGFWLALTSFIIFLIAMLYTQASPRSST